MLASTDGGRLRARFLERRVSLLRSRQAGKSSRVYVGWRKREWLSKCREGSRGSNVVAVVVVVTCDFKAVLVVAAVSQ